MASFLVLPQLEQVAQPKDLMSQNNNTKVGPPNGEIALPLNS